MIQCLFSAWGRLLCCASPLRYMSLSFSLMTPLLSSLSCLLKVLLPDSPAPSSSTCHTRGDTRFITLHWCNTRDAKISATIRTLKSCLSLHVNRRSKQDRKRGDGRRPAGVSTLVVCSARRAVWWDTQGTYGYSVLWTTYSLSSLYYTVLYYLCWILHCVANDHIYRTASTWSLPNWTKPYSLWANANTAQFSCFKISWTVDWLTVRFDSCGLLYFIFKGIVQRQRQYSRVQGNCPHTSKRMRFIPGLRGKYDQDIPYRHYSHYSGSACCLLKRMWYTSAVVDITREEVNWLGQTWLAMILICKWGAHNHTADSR